MSRILLIETDYIMAKNIQDFLERDGYKIDWHVDPQAAIVSVDISKPELIILDLMLAGHSGIEFLYELRSYHDWFNLPVIIFSNVSERELGQSTLALKQLGIAAFHYKPQTSLENLSLSVKQILAPINA